MPDLIADYRDATAQLERITGHCDGLVVDIRQRHDALCRWQAGVADRSSIEELEAALVEFNSGEPPSWSAVRHALSGWVEASERALTLWNALSAEQRSGLAPPAIRRPDDECG